MKFLIPRTKDDRRSKWQRRVMAGTVATMMAVTGMTWLGGFQVSAEETLPLPQRNGRMVAYAYDEADLGLSDNMARHIDQINYSFALIEDGEATGDHWQGIDQLKAYLKRYPHIDGVLAVGGWGADGFSQACATEEGRKKLADSILNLMDEHGFVGVDIDWEYPGSSTAGIASSEQDVGNWYALLKLLREGLDRRETDRGRELILSVALGAGQAHLDAVDGSILNSLVDQAVIMAYDLKGFDRLTGHHAGLYPDGKTSDTGAYAVRKATDSGLDSKKVLLGVPAYGRVWRQVLGGKDGLNIHAATAGNKVLAFPELMALVSSGYSRFYDDKAQAAWWYDGSSFVSGEDEQSLRYKAKWLQEQGLMGTAVWSLSQDPEGELLAILDAALTVDSGSLATATDAATLSDLPSEGD